MGKEHVAQLKHRDPEKRKSAIHHVAKDLNRDALRQLAKMCEDDPDEEVRKLALKAGVYIRQKLGDLPSEHQSEGEKGDSGKSSKPPVIAVTADDARQAQSLVNSALTYQMQNENARAMRYLAQALKADPNLRYDGYFMNVVFGVTGVENAEEGIKLLADANAQKNTVEKESRQKLEKQIQSHTTEANKATWLDVGFDLALLTVVMLVGVSIVMFLGVQVAKGFVTKTEANWQLVDEAVADGRVARPPTEPPTYLTKELNAANKPDVFMEIEPEPALWAAANQVKDLQLLDLLPISFGVTVAVTLITLLTVVVGHVLSQSIFKGIGRLPYFAHLTTSMLIARAIVLMILGGVASVIVFEANSSFVTTVFIGIIGIAVALAAFKLVSITSKSYNFGFVQGLIAVLPGLVVAGALGAFVLL